MGVALACPSPKQNGVGDGQDHPQQLMVIAILATACFWDYYVANYMSAILACELEQVETFGA